MNSRNENRLVRQLHAGKYIFARKISELLPHHSHHLALRCMKGIFRLEVELIDRKLHMEFPALEERVVEFNTLEAAMQFTEKEFGFVLRDFHC